jgi:cytochrome b subunit of formate dehydrogenase
MSAIHPHQLIFSDGEFKNSYSKSKIEQIAKKAHQYWTKSVPKPDIALISN